MKICIFGKSYENCHIHQDNLDGCLSCGNFDTVNEIKIDDLDLSVRSYQSLKHIGVTCLEQLENFKPGELLNFSKKSIEEIEFYMKKYNISWKKI